MSTVASIAIAVLVAVYFIRDRIARKKHSDTIRRIDEQAEQIKDIQDAISASPFVQYPYIYTNATRKY